MQILIHKPLLPEKQSDGPSKPFPDRFCLKCAVFTATQHAVSPIIQQCPRCLLVICDLNVPYDSPCPSCSLSPLASEGALSTFVSSLESKRDSIVHAEDVRLRLESEEMERQRRAIQFPSLEGAAGGYSQQQQPNPVGYASRVGGGASVTSNADHYRRVEQLYRDAQAREAAAASAAAAAKQPGQANNNERRVLSLNTKTHKVKVQTTTKKATTGQQQSSVSDSSKSKSNNARAESEWDDVRRPYVDETDDGLVSGQQQVEVEGKQRRSESQVQSEGVLWRDVLRFATIPQRHTSRLTYQPASKKLGHQTADGGDDEDGEADEEEADGVSGYSVDTPK